MSSVFVFFFVFLFLMIRQPPRSTQSRSSAASDVYKRQVLAQIKGSYALCILSTLEPEHIIVAKKDSPLIIGKTKDGYVGASDIPALSLIHISEPTRLGMISYAVFCLKKKNS